MATGDHGLQNLILRITIGFTLGRQFGHRMWRFRARLLLDGAVSDFHCDVDIAARAFDVVGIEHFGIPPFQKMAFATRFTVVKALPCILYKGQSLFSGGVVYFGWLHIVIWLNDCHFYHTILFVLKDAVGFFNIHNVVIIYLIAPPLPKG
jgi:hypothetical protein